MFTFIFLYILFYYITLFFVFFFFNIFNLPKNFLQLNVSDLWQLLSVYMPNSWNFKLLFLQLSGLPPMFFFYIKFNFLLASIEYTTIFIQILIFVNLLCGTFFYLKLFATKNKKILNNNLKLLAENNSILRNNSFERTSVKYKFVYLLFVFFFINFFSAVFFLDFYFYFENYFF